MVFTTSLGGSIPFTLSVADLLGGIGQRGYAPDNVLVSPNNMTANSAPVPFVASASTSHTDPAFAPWHAFDGDPATFWAAGDGNLPPSWLQIDLGTAHYCATYKLTARNFDFGSWVAFNLAGSANGTDFTVVDTQSGLSWTTGEQKTFVVPVPQSFRYWRFNITATSNGGLDYADIAEVALYS